MSNIYCIKTGKRIIKDRGKRNESSFIDLICKKISEIYQLSYAEVAQITTQNSIEIFKI